MDFIELIQILVICLTAALLFMSVTFLIAHRLGRYDLVDTAWGLTFIVIAITSLLLQGWHKDSQVSLLVTGLIIIWGLRLSSHIYARFRRSGQEDRRYVELRKNWQTSNEALTVYIRIYVTQAILATTVMIPVLIINTYGSEQLSLFAYTGLAVWFTGFIVESTADRQLRRFTADPANHGKLMTIGVWRYSRHPNYFGEILQWWGIGIIALSVPFGWLGLIGPALLTYLIIFVSGVRMSEKRFTGRPGWEAYKANTSVLVPWLPKT